MYFKKTIVLSSLNDTADKAVMNVEKFKNRIEGQIRLYNFKEELKGILTLGFLKDGNVVKAGLQKIENMKYSFVIENGQDIDILEDDKTIACALVNFQEGKAKPLLFGTSDGRLPKSNDLKLASGIQLFDEPMAMDKTISFLDEQEIDYEDELKQEIEQTIDAHISCENKCADCKYRQAFYTLNQEKEEIQEEKLSFYEDVKGQLNELFEKYPEEEFLKDIIPNSKWVKVDYEDSGNYFVVGLIYSEGNLKYICYGLPGLSNEIPSDDIGKNAQWLPLVPENDEGFGYWITYQDAHNGENIQMEII